MREIISDETGDSNIATMRKTLYGFLLSIRGDIKIDDTVSNFWGN